MAWVRFINDFDWWPSPRVTISYKTGMLLNVTRRCAEKAIKAGKAERAANPRHSASSKSGKGARRFATGTNVAERDGQ